MYCLLLRAGCEAVYKGICCGMLKENLHCIRTHFAFRRIFILIGLLCVSRLYLHTCFFLFSISRLIFLSFRQLR